MRPNIENFIGCDSSYRAASIVLYGAPYDSTTSYRPGARFGPSEGLFTREFYGSCFNALKEDGIMVNQQGSWPSWRRSLTRRSARPGFPTA